MSKIISEKRWKEAQKKEASFWRSVSKKDIKKSMAHYSFLSKEFSWANKNTEILDIGCADCCISLFIKGKKTGLDTLPFPNAPIKVIQGNAETFDNGKKYDIIIASNMLDHCRDPELVLTNIKNLLKNNSYFFISLNTYNYFTSKILKFIEIIGLPYRQKAHPHIYTESEFKKQIAKYFKIEKETFIDSFDMYEKSLYFYFIKIFNCGRKNVRTIGLICRVKLTNT